LNCFFLLCQKFPFSLFCPKTVCAVHLLVHALLHFPASVRPFGQHCIFRDLFLDSHSCEFFSSFMLLLQRHYS
jgi:hypothetical protein